MINRPKNKILFVIFILIILLIISILIIAVYSTKKKNIEEYKISPNTVLYDENYEYISLNKNAILRKEWDDNYYLILNNSEKYLLGNETVLFDRNKNQILIYGSIHQVFTNGDISRKNKKTTINNVSDFQFFKLDDRKYLIIGSSIGNENFSTKNYLIVSIDKAGNALLVNNEINIKTINPLIINCGKVNFDVANERLNYEKEVIDLKKINGSTNEYVEKEEEEKGTSQNNQQNNTSNQTPNNSTGGNVQNNNSQVYNDIINQIVNISGILGNQNKTDLYKNISLRGITAGASYLKINYSIVDPEEKYSSVFLTITDQEGIFNNYYIDKNSNSYRVSGLKPNSQYEVKISYVQSGYKDSIVADSIIVLTNNDPTLVRITKIQNNNYHYKVKLYNESDFVSANIVLTNCTNKILAEKTIDVTSALTASGSTGIFENVNISELTNEADGNKYLCLKVDNALDSTGNLVGINSYHKIKID